MTTEQETNLREALRAAYPAATPSEALQHRVAALTGGAAASSPPRQPRRWPVGLRLAAVAATVAATFALLLPPKLTAVQAFQRMTNSLRNVQSVHNVTWHALPDGTPVKSGEIWYQAGSWRVENTDGGNQEVQISRNGTRWTYDRGANTVTQDKAVFPAGYGAVSGFSLAAILHDAVKAGNQTHVSLLGATTVAGRPATVILLYSQWLYDTQEPRQRSRITVDDATDLPVRSEEQHRTGDGGPWVTEWFTEAQYNQPLSAAVFLPDFPPTARLIEADAERERWRERLGRGVEARTVEAGSHDTPEQTNTRTTVAVRDFQVNARGDVFLLFTAGTHVGRDLPFGTAELTDEFGTKYLDPSTQKRSTGDFIPTCVDSSGGDQGVNGFLFHGDQLEGKWWVPLQRQVPWKPRHFRLTLHLDQERVKGASTAVFDLPVSQAGAENLPAYMPYMARPLSANLTSEEDATRAYSLYHDAHDLPQALAAYRELIDARSQEQKQSGVSHITNSQEWFEVYHILTEMGRREEATAALLRAKQDDDTYRFSPVTHDAIRAALTKLGMTH